MPRRRVIDQIGDLAQQFYRERLAPQVTEEASLPRSPTMPRRSRARRLVTQTEPDPAKREYGEPVFTWAFPSSKPRGGTIVTYETRLEEDGTLRCNCMGWVFQRKDAAGNPKPRECKHTQRISNEAPDILRRWRRGDELPVFNPEALEASTNAPRPSPTTAPRATTDTRLRPGRVIDL
jgi:hypothetical protein